MAAIVVAFTDGSTTKFDDTEGFEITDGFVMVRDSERVLHCFNSDLVGGITYSDATTDSEIVADGSHQPTIDQGIACGCEVHVTHFVCEAACALHGCRVSGSL